MDQKTIDALLNNWVWVPNWVDAPPDSSINTAGRVVRFVRKFCVPESSGAELVSAPDGPAALLHFSADTRYKLYVNGVRVAVGPARSSQWMWFYDSLDIQPWLHLNGRENELVFVVVRYFSAFRGAMPFVRTILPGLTVVGRIGEVDLGTAADGWTAQVNDRIIFPTGLIDDGFLHISERVSADDLSAPVKPVKYSFRTANGELLPWRLHPRPFPKPEETHVDVDTIRACHSTTPAAEWAACLAGQGRGPSLVLPAGSVHTLDIQATCHSTAFLKWSFASTSTETGGRVRVRVMYSEGYEQEPRSYPFFRTKSDRLDAKHGYIIGPFDEAVLDVPATGSSRGSSGNIAVYEPFWFRTFRVVRVTISVDSIGAAVQLLSLTAQQTNYPLAVKAEWHDDKGLIDAHSSQIWDVSLRTLRNCLFDGYSDCPFYEQLQYAGDSRSVALFHYLLSGDDRLMRTALVHWAASVESVVDNGPLSLLQSPTAGLLQSRVPCSAPQLIAGFSLFWVLAVVDHYQHFGDTAMATGFLGRIDGVLAFFDRHLSPATGLVSGLPPDVWQYVDWVDTWGATATHPDKGVPTSGRASNTHTFFSLLYAYTLQQAALLLQQLADYEKNEEEEKGLDGRSCHRSHCRRRHLYRLESLEYSGRATTVVRAVRRHCYDGRFFTDSTTDVAAVKPEGAYSQHCQVFAVLAGATVGPCSMAEEKEKEDVTNTTTAAAGLPLRDASSLLRESFAPDSKLSRCSYVMQFYALRAFAAAGNDHSDDQHHDDIYEAYWPVVWRPWHAMLANRLSTWEEDAVRQRSDCHAWGCVPIYEYCTEVAGVHIAAPGAAALVFRPRLRLAAHLHAKVCLGRSNTATVRWWPAEEEAENKQDVEDVKGAKDAKDGRPRRIRVELALETAIRISSQLPGQKLVHHGVTDHVELLWAR